VALEGGHDEIIQILVENKADVNTRDKDGNTALHRAVKTMLIQILKMRQ
jgi:ankyrin repeat protein